jgi:REP-associated tyrosine transposase
MSSATIVRRRRNDSTKPALTGRRRRYGRRVARRPRSFAPGAATHLTSHGVDDRPIFLTDLDRFQLLALLRRVSEQVGWRVVAWCLMTTHYHLLVVGAAEPRISWAMQKLNSVYAREFNRRHRRRGHLFGERFTDTVVESDEHLGAAIDYILENPVRAGLVQGVGHWPWSGDHRLEPRALRRIVTPEAENRDILVRLGR